MLVNVRHTQPVDEISLLAPTTVVYATGGNSTQKYTMEEILDALYPVGSIYICAFDTGTTCPLAKWGGKWTKVSSGRVLQGADSKHNPDTIIEAGLPNITGKFRTEANTSGATGGEFMQGAFYRGEAFGAHIAAGIGGTNAVIGFDASKGTASAAKNIYKNDCTTVQPPAYVVVIWKRIA